MFKIKYEDGNVDLSSLYTKSFDMQEVISSIIGLDTTVNLILNDPFPEAALTEAVKACWDSEEEFENVCMALIERIVGMNKNWERMDAVREAAKELLAVHVSQGVKTIQVHSRVLHEFQIATDDEYNLLRKQIFGE